MRKMFGFNNVRCVWKWRFRAGYSVVGEKGTEDGYIDIRDGELPLGVGEDEMDGEKREAKN